MGWCHEFGVEIEPTCGHPMTARGADCACTECGTVCKGRFEGGCEAVWRRGPRKDAPGRASVAGTAVHPRPRGAAALVNGGRQNGSAFASTTDAPANGTAVSPRVQDLQLALANLADQVSRQNQHLAMLEGHISDLGRVLGQLGVEVDERLGLLEDGRSNGQQQEV